MLTGTSLWCRFVEVMKDLPHYYSRVAFSLSSLGNLSPPLVDLSGVEGTEI